MAFSFTDKLTKSKLSEFAEMVQNISDEIGFKISARGWCYQLEGYGHINKDEFNKVENWINRCRKEGVLPIDFVAEEEGRQFSVVHRPDQQPLIKNSQGWLNGLLRHGESYTPDWWEGEEYYIQMLVEKIDLKTLFTPVCEDYHIPIATSKGWSSMLQRGEYAKRYAEAEAKGLKCVLLYCGDHDPSGLRISDFMMSNLEDLKHITWSDGTAGFDPQNLIIERFGLNYDFIVKHKLTWIDNLITGNTQKKMDLSDPSHKDHNLKYVQQYIKNFGVRKCEANAIVPKPKIASDLVTNAIQQFVGKKCLQRFAAKRQDIEQQWSEFLERSGLDRAIREAEDMIQND